MLNLLVNGNNQHKDFDNMQLILLSGGSGKRLWPLSNNARSKQFLPVLASPNGGKESMIQRLVRQINASSLNAEITVATNTAQRDSIISQLGEKVKIVLEPERRDTFPAIALSVSYLALEKKCSYDEVVVVMPCDAYTEEGYFEVIGKMAEAVKQKAADLVLMGIAPTAPSEKYGYIVPENRDGSACDTPEWIAVKRFEEKPGTEKAAELIKENAMWNGGVFAFRLGYLKEVVGKYITANTFEDMVTRFAELPKISFDYEVVEKAKSVAVVCYDGLWKDLGTWNTLCDELPESYFGKVVAGEGNSNVHAINELNIPMFVSGLKDTVVAASADGIMVSGKEESEKIKDYADQLITRPMYEERRWGTYKVLDAVTYKDGRESLTKTITLNPGKHISYQVHHHRKEVWTVVEGEGEFVLDGERKAVHPNDVLVIPIDHHHAIKAGPKGLTFIEVQIGSPLIEEDIDRFDYQW